MEFSSKVQSIYGTEHCTIYRLQCVPTGHDQSDCAICRTHGEGELGVQTIQGTYNARYRQYKVQTIQGTLTTKYIHYKVQTMQGTDNTRYIQYEVQTIQGTDNTKY